MGSFFSKIFSLFNRDSRSQEHNTSSSYHCSSYKTSYDESPWTYYGRSKSEDNYDYFQKKARKQIKESSSKADPFSNFSNVEFSRLNQPTYESRSYTTYQHCVQPPDFLPRNGLIGTWQPAYQFKGTSYSFGFFSCRRCQNTWTSKQSKKQLKQKCKECNYYNFPAYLWLNKYKNI